MDVVNFLLLSSWLNAHGESLSLEISLPLPLLEQGVYVDLTSIPLGSSKAQPGPRTRAGAEKVADTHGPTLSAHSLETLRCYNSFQLGARSLALA